MRAHRADYPVATQCRVLGVSTSGYYAWRKRAPSSRSREDADLSEKIRSSHEKSQGTYGSPRIQADLAEAGYGMGRKRVARLMRAEGLQGVTRRKSVRTTQRSERQRPAPDLVDRDFTASGPNQLWVADITYVSTWSGFLYLAVVLDVWSRRIVGWAMQTHLRTELVLEALEMALYRRRPSKVIHHSDQGSQYTSIAFGRRCDDAGVRPSMGSVGDCYDNALCESFFATLECERLDRRSYRSPAEAKPDLFEYMEGFYNPRRRHSALGQRSPMQFEREEMAELDVEAALATRFRRTLGVEPQEVSTLSVPPS